MNSEKIGHYIAMKRIQKGLKQREVADHLNVSEKTISRWENGNYMPDLSLLIDLASLLSTSVYELLLGEDYLHNVNPSNIETEVRFLYSLPEEIKIIEYLRNFDQLQYKGCFEETTRQYNHPMPEYNYYSKEIDARLRLRTTINNNIKRCMLSYKRRSENFLTEEINTEEEVEVSLNYNDVDNLTYILENVIHLNLVESYSRRRHIFSNEDIEVAVDIYPFMIAVEIENKSTTKDPKAVILYYLNLLGFDLHDSYRLSWDDKYEELCKEQNVPIHKTVDFSKEMPKFIGHHFDLKN